MKTRIFLAIVALLFAAFGIWAVMDPLGMTARLGVDVTGPNGAYEMRGIYGGVSLGAAALTLAGALRQSMLRPALWFLVAYMGGYILMRMGALALGPAPTASFAMFIGFEAATLLLAILALRANRGA